MRELRVAEPWRVLGEQESFEVHACCRDGPLARMCFVGSTFEKRGVAFFWDECAYPRFLAGLSKRCTLEALPAGCSVLYFAEGRRVADRDLPLSVTVGFQGELRSPVPAEVVLIDSCVQALPLAFEQRITGGPFWWKPVRVPMHAHDSKHWIELRPAAPRMRAV
jgi:hypothetical protein